LFVYYLVVVVGLVEKWRGVGPDDGTPSDGGGKALEYNWWTGRRSFYQVGVWIKLWMKIGDKTS
jgi:hypothetical protein